MLLHFSITTKSVSRYRGQEHCLHPKLQSTKRFIKWYNAWNEKRRYGPPPRTFLPTFPPLQILDASQLIEPHLLGEHLPQ